MSGDAHVRICESLGVRFPRATRLVARESKCICGALSMARARFWKFLFSPGATRPRQCAFCASSFVARALSPRLLSPIN